MTQPDLQLDCEEIRSAADRVHNCADEVSRAQGGAELKNSARDLPGSGLETAASAASANLKEARNTFARRLEKHVGTINFVVASLTDADIDAAHPPRR
jgi:hypothetical protein